jgi:hypothetical protein
VRAKTFEAALRARALADAAPPAARKAGAAMAMKWGGKNVVAVVVM